MPDNPALHDLVIANRNGVLVTIKADGRPQLSNIVYAVADDVIRISVTDTRAKTRNLRRDPRASLHVTSADFYSYAVVEGTAELSPVATSPDDPVVDELVELYRSLGGEHDDWDAYRQAMVADQRMIASIPISRIYGMAPR